MTPHRELNKTTVFDDSSDSDNVQNTFPSISRHATNL